MVPRRVERLGSGIESSARRRDRGRCGIVLASHISGRGRSLWAIAWPIGATVADRSDAALAFVVRVLCWPNTKGNSKPQSDKLDSGFDRSFRYGCLQGQQDKIEQGVEAYRPDTDKS
jgi:hypothetical protein